MSKKDLEKQAVIAAREYGVSSVLFRNAVGSKLGLSATDMECLWLLFIKRVCTPTGLAHYTGLTTGSVTALLDRLEKAGLITRRPNPADRRGVLIDTNEKAKETVGPLFAEARKLQNEFVTGYSEEELTVITDFLKKYTDVFEQSRQKLG